MSIKQKNNGLVTNYMIHATDVQLLDVNENFTSTTVEGALKENLNKIGDLSGNGLTEIDLANAIKNDRSQMSDMENNFTDRIFKPKFCISTYWGQNNDYYGSVWHASRSAIDNDINNWVNAKVDGVTLIIHISYNYNTKTFYVCENLEDMDYSVQQMQSKGLLVSAIKLHNNFTSTEITDATDSAYQTAWLGFINSIGTRYKNSNIPILTIMNEFPNIYNDSNHVSFLVNCINTSKSLGYKVGITTTNDDVQWFTMNSSICNILDYICINFYPILTNKNNKASYSDCLYSWRSQTFIDKVKYLIDTYPNAKFIVSECGVQDYMIALSNPAKYSWNSSDMVLTGGIAQSMFMLGLFEYLNEDCINQVWWWFGITNSEYTNNITKHYVGGMKYGVQ